MHPLEEEETYNENLLLAILRINIHIFSIASVIYIIHLKNINFKPLLNRD